MTRNDFEIIARTIAKISNTNARRTAADLFAVELAYLCPRFSRDRFIEACGCVKVGPLPLLEHARPGWHGGLAPRPTKEPGIPMRNMRDFDRL